MSVGEQKVQYSPETGHEKQSSDLMRCTNRPKDYFFEGPPGRNTQQSAYRIIVHAVTKAAGIKKKTSLHTLRLTYATHSLEKGVDLGYIQDMMGHSSSKTTGINTAKAQKALIE